MAAKKNFKATRDFEYGKVEYKVGDTFTIPDDWELDKAENETLQQQDKKSALRAKQEFKSWRMVFVHTIPVYQKDDRGRPTDEHIGNDYRRVILPVT